MDIDTIGRKVYFTNGWNILRANVDGTDKQVAVKLDSLVNDVAVDWIGRRIFWIAFDGNLDKIYMATIDGKKRRVLVSGMALHNVAADPIMGYVLLISRSH